MYWFKRPLIAALSAAAVVASIYTAGCVSEDPARLQPEAVKIAVPYGSRLTTDFGDAKATSVTNAGGIATTLTDPSGAVLATLSWLTSSDTFTWTVTGVGSTTESNGDGLPSLKGSNFAVYYVYKNVQAAVAAGKPGADASAFDNPGCDWFPDWLETECILACCATHDACYAANRCGASSWLPGFGSAACKACNRAVVKCIASCVANAVGEVILPH